GDVLAGAVGAFQYNQYMVTGRNVEAAIGCGKACSLAKTDIILSKTIRNLAAERILADELTQSQFTKNGLTIYKFIKFAQDYGK
ncbi:MAG: hypothetical protein FWH35_08315, partial [Treponema sp.]|nr:hypothetical protein [Treponema sp.]